MESLLLIKSSSRAGRFKKKLLSLENLMIQAPKLVVKLTPLRELFSLGKITDAEFTSLYIIALLSERYPGQWLGAKRPSLNIHHKLPFKISDIPFELEKNILSRMGSFETIGDLLNHFAFKSTPESVNRAILQWSQGHYGLELMDYIPQPKAVLEQQRIGRRCVTVLTSQDDLSKYILNERDALSFTMHDLIHADHFYKDNHCFKGQLAFYGFLDYCLEENFFEHLLIHKKFKDEFEYLVADMNAYAIHLFKCLKAAIIHYDPRKEDFFKDWVLKVTQDAKVREALLNLNSKNYIPETEDQIILEFLKLYESDFSKNLHLP